MSIIHCQLYIKRIVNDIKMAKKNFKSGLGDLLSDALDMPKEKPIPKKRTARKTTSKKKVTKSFMSDLDGFLQDAIEEGVQEQATKIKTLE